MSQSSRPQPFLSVRMCVALAILAGVIGLLLVRIVPPSRDHDWAKRYVEWGKTYDAQVSACGKHEPRDLECLKNHPVGPRP